MARPKKLHFLSIETLRRLGIADQTDDWYVAFLFAHPEGFRKTKSRRGNGKTTYAKELVEYAVQQEKLGLIDGTEEIARREEAKAVAGE